MDTPWWLLAENNRQQRQRELDTQKSGRDRNRLGQFATPFTLARQIISVARTYQPLPVQKVRFLEPAIGLGAFYSAFLDITQGHPPEMALGFEIDPHLIESSRQIWQDTGLSIRPDDFTSTPPPSAEPQKFNLLVTNPPYVRHHHLTKQQKQQLGRAVVHRLGLRPSGLMGLYGYFLLLAHDWMQPDGLGVWLIPVEFMDVDYGAVLKTYLLNKVELLRVHRFDADDAQFTDADVTSTVLFLRNRPPAETHEVLFSTGPNLEKPQHAISVPRQKLANIRKWSLIGQDQAAIPQLEHPHRRSDQVITLGDLFHIKRGLATGANQFFIMSRLKAKQRGIPDIFLKPILPSPRYLRDQRIIESDASGHPSIEPNLVLLDCVLPKEQLAEQYPALHHYILQGEAAGLHNRYLLSRRDPWYRQEERAVAPILCGYMARKNKTDGKSIRFYRNKSQAIAANVYLMLYPKPAMTHYYHADIEILYDHIFEQLSTLKQYEVVHHGRTYGGGLDKIEPNELARVVLPRPNEIEGLLQALRPLMNL